MLKSDKDSNKFSFLNKFAIGNKENLIHKLNHFSKSGVDSIHFVIDFDMTITTGTTKDMRQITTWQILKSYLPDEAKREYENLYTRYYPLEQQGRLTDKEAVIWWETTLLLFKQNNLNIFAVEKELIQKAQKRKYVKKLFTFCRNLHIPTVILSSGIKDVIDIWCKTQGIKPDYILSTKLNIDETGIITGWDKNTLIHIHNKNEKHRELAGLLKKRPLVILIGDSMDDPKAVTGEENVLRIRIKDPVSDPVKRVKLRKESFSKFDLLIETGDFSPVIELLKKFSLP